MTSNKSRIFLCHSSADKSNVRSLYHHLKKDGYHPWLDEEDLLPGQDWQYEIRKAVRSSAIVIVCLSKDAVNKRGYIQKAIVFALDTADEQPEGKIFIIPVRLEDCEVPSRLSRWQWVNLYEDNGYQRLTKALRSVAENHALNEEKAKIIIGNIDKVNDKRNEDEAGINKYSTGKRYRINNITLVFIFVSITFFLLSKYLRFDYR